jgi:pilus assembly protein CpaC
MAFFERQESAKMPQLLAHRSAVAALAMAATVAGVLPVLAADPTPAMQPVSVRPAVDNGLVRTVKVGLNKSVVVDLPRDARDILVSNPDIADAVIRTPTRIYITGVKAGQSNVIVFDRAGQQIVTLQLEVARDTTGLAATLNRLLPDANIDVDVVNDNIVLSGSVKNAAESQRAQDVATVFVNGDNGLSAGGANAPGGNNASGQTASPGVVNLLTIQGEDQVQVKVTVSEVQRNIVKQLGIDWNLQNIQIGPFNFSGSTALPYSVNNATPGNSFGATYIDPYLARAEGTTSTADPTVAYHQFGMTIQALEQTGLFKVLAEPTLTAISGESASFLAGGEYPVPTGKDQSGNVTIEFKPYGVALSMTPIVLSDGRISLHVKTEVSELSTQTLVLQGTSIPGLNIRRAETTLELPSGGSMVLGGLLQDSDRQAVARIPGLGTLPVLGQLFRSRDFQRNETELVIIVTPYLVKPVARSALATPDQGLATPSDSQTLLFGNLNRLYGNATAAPAAKKYQGNVGYIYQ